MVSDTNVIVSRTTSGFTYTQFWLVRFLFLCGVGYLSALAGQLIAFQPPAFLLLPFLFIAYFVGGAAIFMAMADCTYRRALAINLVELLLYAAFYLVLLSAALIIG